MIKKFTRFQIAALKRTMKNISPLLRRRNTLEKKAKEILEEIKDVDAQITAYKQTIEPITGGIDPEVIIACDGEVEIQEGDPIPAEEGVVMEAEGQELSTGMESEMPFQE